MLEELANSLGVDLAKIKSFFDNKNVKYFWTEADKETLQREVDKTAYERGKLAGEEMPYKNHKRSYLDKTGIIAEAFKSEDVKTWDTLLEKINTMYSSELEKAIEDVKKDYGENADQRIGELKNKLNSALELSAKEKENLINTLKTKEADYQKQLKEKDSLIFSERKGNILNKAFDSLDFVVPVEIKQQGNDAVIGYKKTLKNNSIDIFNSRYELDFDEKGQPKFINKQTGETIVNELQQPKDINVLIKEFAESNYLPVKANREGGRGDGDYISGNWKGFTKLSQVTNYCKEKSINPGSSEAGKILTEIIKENPNFDMSN